MAERQLKIMAATLEGHPLLEEIDSYTAPNVEFATTESRGGRFAARNLKVGLNAMEASIALNGADSALYADLSPVDGEEIELYVRRAMRTESGGAVAVKDWVTGTVRQVEEKESKMGELPQRTVHLDVVAFKRTEDGKTTYDIDVKTQKINLGQGDIMAKFRQAAEI